MCSINFGRWKCYRDKQRQIQARGIAMDTYNTQINEAYDTSTGGTMRPMRVDTTYDYCEVAKRGEYNAYSSIAM